MDATDNVCIIFCGCSYLHHFFFQGQNLAIRFKKPRRNLKPLANKDQPPPRFAVEDQDALVVEGAFRGA